MSATTPSRTWARPNTECRCPWAANERPRSAAQRTAAATSSSDAGISPSSGGGDGYSRLATR
jgi:hypothetical protein